jgi:hypothetical protein
MDEGWGGSQLEVRGIENIDAKPRADTCIYRRILTM